MTSIHHTALTKLREQLAAAAQLRDVDERADALAAIVGRLTPSSVNSLAATTNTQEQLGLCVLARQFKRAVPLSAIESWQADSEPQVRAAVVAAIAYRKVDAGVVQVLRMALADEDERVRVAAVRAVQENGDTSLQSELNMLTDDPSGAVQRWLANRR